MFENIFEINVRALKSPILTADANQIDFDKNEGLWNFKLQKIP